MPVTRPELQIWLGNALTISGQLKRLADGKGVCQDLKSFLGSVLLPYGYI